MPIQKAASILPELIKRASDGETIIIGDKDFTEVTLQPISRKVLKERKIGFLDGINLCMADDFDAPLPDDILTGFGYK